MHASSFDHCRHFVEQYLDDRTVLQIADVGSYDVNGTYRPLFTRPCWEYVGFDVVAGPNVDVVLPQGNDELWTPAAAFDVVVSGQCVEHVQKPWQWIKHVASLAKKGGIVWIAGPNTWVYHEYPIDCWRIWPDGMRALFDEAGLQEISCFYEGADTIGIARKP